ncbi:carboxymuconolactone decarboxylase family protein [Amphritea sp. HPY]|uniref:carboxymuconolactone decarboxylase family protein n=1 Tax=Amphritea sp. HPY TaxID=3421652 RepID=UPI003D7D8818
MMSQRIDFFSAAPQGLQQMLNLEQYIGSCAERGSLNNTLITLIKLRVSQINGCAYCIDMHTKEAKAAGETEQRLHLLCAWRETSFYSQQERAALAWAEANTLIAENNIDDDLYQATHQQFSESQMVDLTLVICTINSWNRLAISFRSEPGSYQPGGH